MAASSTSAALSLPACTDGTAYASLLTSHGSAGGNTFLARTSAHSRQLLLLLTLLRSLRAHERICARPFVLLRGVAVTLPPKDVVLLEAAGGAAGFVQHEIAPIKLGIPPFDKLHAWNLSASRFSRLLVIDADAMMLGPVEELFAPTPNISGALLPRERTAAEDTKKPLLMMAHHGYDKAQDKCGHGSIPLERRGVGGFYVMVPDASEFERLVRQTTKFKEEQTGVACFFDRRHRLATLPCPYFYDIAYEQHVPTGIHHRGCLKEGVGRLGVEGVKACNASAVHIREHCTWEVSYQTAKAVHFKGSAKPWRVFSCFNLRQGRLRLWPSNVTLGPNDVLSWDTKNAACVSRRHSLATSRGEYVSYGGDADSGGGPRGEKLPLQCCRFTSLIKAEWWHHYRSGPILPSLGGDDSWVRLGRWVKNKTKIAKARNRTKAARAGAVAAKLKPAPSPAVKANRQHSRDEVARILARLREGARARDLV